MKTKSRRETPTKPSEDSPRKGDGKPRNKGEDGASPTSIANVSLVSTPPLRRLRSVIAVREDGGTEVTLSESKANSMLGGLHLTDGATTSISNKNPSQAASLITPTQLSTTGDMRTSYALLDSEVSPSPLKCSKPSFDDSVCEVSSTPDDLPTPHKIPHPLCGVMCYDAGLPLSALEMQRKISKFLSSPVQVDAWFQGWQAWSYFYMQRDQPANSEALKHQIKRVFQNRALNMNARKAHLNTLRRDLSPFNATPVNLQGHPTASIADRSRPRSFSTYVENKEPKAPHRALSNESVVTPEKTVPLWQCGIQCGLHDDEDSPLVSRSSRPTDVLVEEDDVCYDSDPEDFVRRQARTERTSNKMPPSPTESANKENVGPVQPALIAYDEARATGEDDEEAKVIVQEIMNERMTLILHQNSQNWQTKALRPKGVYAWVERGKNLKNSVIPPRFVWTPISRSAAAVQEASSSTTARRKQHKFLQNEDTDSIQLLDIHRILEAEKIDRMVHPFAKKRNTFLIKTLDRTVMFECSSGERYRIVESLKMAVARLGTLLLLRDDELIDEFFAGGESEHHQGPGEEPEPYWLHTV